MTKKIIFLQMALLVCCLFAANKQVFRVHYYDGSYKDFPVDRITKITFSADPEDETIPDPRYEPDTLISSSQSSLGSNLVETHRTLGNVAR